MGFLARFLPSIAPALGALANPWLLLALLSALVGAFFYGVHMEAGHFEAFKAQVAALGEKQTARAIQAGKDRKAITKENDDANELALGKLRDTVTALERRLRTYPNGSVLPPRQQPVPTSGPDLACFERGELDAALRRFTADVAGLVGEGATAVTNLDSAKRWGAAQLKLSTSLEK